jgi:hypothetical protein
MRIGLAACAGILVAAVLAAPAEARTCKQIRALCFEMRANDNDCTMPYRRCLKTGVFITPLGRRFVATPR